MAGSAANRMERMLKIVYAGVIVIILAIGGGVAWAIYLIVRWLI